MWMRSGKPAGATSVTHSGSEKTRTQRIIMLIKSFRRHRPSDKERKGGSLSRINADPRRLLMRPFAKEERYTGYYLKTVVRPSHGVGRPEKGE
jgi:hypothetical protein